MTVEKKILKPRKGGFQLGEINNPNGMQKKEIDFNLAGDLCNIGCTQEEICTILKVDDKTLMRCIKESGFGNFSEFFEAKRTNHEISLRRKKWKVIEAQLDRGLEGNDTAMLIWLGKQYHGQKEPKHELPECTITPEILEEQSQYIQENKLLLKHIAQLRSENKHLTLKLDDFQSEENEKINEEYRRRKNNRD